ncbi:RsmD family RNA methyltransferase [Bifidobacterium sp. 82T10]|uniref:RsmD family RNA methyltransferase n=1 Tax=Bifidobacterium miconis TaxID=2834435 RepID=A0ABS6WHY9_9BIFI|nr:class I SAM-dependent methyltransferase [Bifidobacterium miconis]MBW3093650.1 RsmD family RNA methyltransferase [Bifidobacterium miconis]
MLMSPETARFAVEHRNEDVRELALKAKRADGLDLPMALDQIAGWQTARAKLPQWAACEGIVYPPHISMEQCSSEFTARYKAAVARRIVRDNAEDTAEDGSAYPGTMIDLTGGFGVDFSYIARGFERAIYVERQEHLCALAEHNMRALGLEHAIIVNDDAETVLDRETAALIFIDPARRDAHGGRTVAIEDCTPNVLALRDRLLEAAPHVMIKLSPMLDWRKAVADFRGAVGEVHIVSTGNECKELLLVLNRETNAIVHVYCVNDADRLDYDYDPTAAAASATGRSLGLTPLPEKITYLYEPNASIMKAGCFALVEERYGVTQIGPNSHLFISGGTADDSATADDPAILGDGPRPVADFPGRTFTVETVTGMGKKELKQALANLAKANITVRNFPLTAVQLRKKLRLNDGGDTYLFATTLAGAKHVILRCHRL